MYQVIGTARSRAMRVFCMLEELEQDYEIIEATPGSEKAAEINPSGKIPALIDDGNVIYDSVAIMQYLADKHGKLTAPCGTVARAVQDSFVHFANDEMDSVLWVSQKHLSYYPEKVRLPDVRYAAEWDYLRALRTLDQRLGDNEFVMGDEISVPDLLISHCANWAAALRFKKPKGRVAAYFRRLNERPATIRAFKKAVASAKNT